ncbi:MAG: alpha-glucan family phosphorylase [Phycisphaerales bacterium]
MGLPYLAISLLYRKGYFTQRLDENGRQSEHPTAWVPEELLHEEPARVAVPIEGRQVVVRAFKYEVIGATGHRVPVYFLDTDLPENSEQDRTITHALYAGGTQDRIRQEAILGIGGRRMVRAIGHDVERFHMNEGHACFLTVELLSEHICKTGEHHISGEAIRSVRKRCCFTTHTPVPAGHDRFSIDDVRRIIGDHPVFHRQDIYGEQNVLNTTMLAMNLSRYSNGVAQKHAEVSRAMFPGYAIDGVTNGVHAGTWACPSMRDLFDRFAPGWRTDNNNLRHILAAPGEAVWAAHQRAKQALVEEVMDRGGPAMKPDVFTIGFARRSTAYKRPAMLVSDIDRLKAIAAKFGGLQIVYAGKAHPHDETGKRFIETIVAAAERLGPDVSLAFLPNYDMDLAGKYVAGVDLWLNTPEPPKEASGTSGMKAALNGVPSLSTLDGWWLEGWGEGRTGWSIGQPPRGSEPPADMDRHAAEMYEKLERTILPMYAERRSEFIEVMRDCIAVNGPYFTTQRMVEQYALRAYFA